MLAVEDLLSEAVARQILDQINAGFQISSVLGHKGNTYLKHRATNLNQAAKGYPIFLLTDLDRPDRCPPRLIHDWVKMPKHDNFIFRVAVMEVESWVMAHREAFADFLSIPWNRVPLDTDAISRPKEFLVSLARSSRASRIRRDLVPAQGATSKVGPAYNSRLQEFVQTEWRVEEASSVSSSLNRTLKRLQAFRV